MCVKTHVTWLVQQDYSGVTSNVPLIDSATLCIQGAAKNFLVVVRFFSRTLYMPIFCTDRYRRRRGGDGANGTRMILRSAQIQWKSDSNYTELDVGNAGW